MYDKLYYLYIIIKRQKHRAMKTLDLIRYITQHPEYTNVVIMDNDDMTPMTAINYLAEIDAPYFDSYVWHMNGSLEKNTLLIYTGIEGQKN